MVGCWLVRHGMTGDEALAQIAQWWQGVRRQLQPGPPSADHADTSALILRPHRVDREPPEGSDGSSSGNVTALSERQTTNLVVERRPARQCVRTLGAVRSAHAPCFGATASEPQKGATPAVCRSRDGSGAFKDNYMVWGRSTMRS